MSSLPRGSTVRRDAGLYGYERALRQSYLGNSIKASERQLPQLWTSYQGVKHILDMPADYDLYVTSALYFNAVTIGSSKPMIVVRSNLLDKLGPGEQRVIVAHELGHILSDHVLYFTALNIPLALLVAIAMLVALFGDGDLTPKDKVVRKVGQMKAENIL